MELKNIVSVTGKPGLYEIKAKSKNGLIVESLLDGKKIPINLAHNISSLNEIAIYTYEKEVPLREVFKKINENATKAISEKENSTKLTSYFREILPDFDEERVYTSNIKKVLQWYHLLASKEFDFNAIEEEIIENTEEAN